VQASGLINVTTIAGGEYHTIALNSDGTVWAWGENWDGQLGDGTETNSTTPVQISTLNLGSTVITTPTPSECTATEITASANSLTIKRLKKSSVTVTVTGDGDCEVKGEKVTAKVDASGKKMVSVKPASVKTGEDGSATFTLKAKSKTGATRVDLQHGRWFIAQRECEDYQMRTWRGKIRWVGWAVPTLQKNETGWTRTGTAWTNFGGFRSAT